MYSYIPFADNNQYCFALFHLDLLGWRSCAKTSFRELYLPRLPNGQASLNSQYSTTTSREHSHVWNAGQICDHWACRRTTFEVVFRMLITSGRTLCLPMFIAMTSRAAFPSRSATGVSWCRPFFMTTALLVAFQLAFATRASPISLPMIPILLRSFRKSKSRPIACLRSNVRVAPIVIDSFTYISCSARTWKSLGAISRLRTATWPRRSASGTRMNPGRGSRRRKSRKNPTGWSRPSIPTMCCRSTRHTKCRSDKTRLSREWPQPTATVAVGRALVLPPPTPQARNTRPCPQGQRPLPVPGAHSENYRQ